MLVTSEGVSMSTAVDARESRAGVALVALLLVVVAQVVRLLFPVMFEIGEDWDFLAAGIVALVVFSAPVVAIPATRLRRPVGIVAGAVAAGGALVVAQLLDPIPGPAVMALVAVALVGATLVVAELDDGRSRDWLVPAVFLGLAFDVAIRAVSITWDLPWRTEWVPRIAGAALVAGLIAVSAVAAGRRASPGVGVRPLAFVVAGALAALELLFVANIGFVGSQGDLALASATVVVLAGIVGGVLALGLLRRVPWPDWSTATLAVVAVASAWLLPTVTGTPVIPLVLVLQVVLGVLFALVVAHPSSSGPRPVPTVGAMTGGSVLFAVIVLLWQLHIDQPLPFPRQAIPALAAAIVAVPALRFAIARVPTMGFERRAVVAIAAALMVAVPTWLRATVADPTPDRDDPRELALVSYNVRGAVDVDGQLRPDRVADEIRSSDPDVVVLQEVGRGWPIHGTLDLLSYLSRELDMEAVFAPAADDQFGNAILSRLPIEVIDSGRLPKDGSQERSYLMVELTTTAGPVTVVGTHIQSRSVPQVTALLQVIDGRTPVVVAGDMNIKPPDPEVALFTQAGLVDVIGATGDPCRTTSAEPGSSCDRPDWVFASSDIAIDGARIGSTVASDHLAIHAVLRLD